VAAALIAGMLQRGGTERGVTAAPAAQTIVAIGDSIVYGLHDAGGAGGWAGRLGSILGQTYPGQQYRVINAGINGDTSAGVLKRLSRDVVGKNPDLVIVAIGTNDFDYNIPVATFRANLTGARPTRRSSPRASCPRCGSATTCCAGRHPTTLWCRRSVASWALGTRTSSTPSWRSGGAR